VPRHWFQDAEEAHRVGQAVVKSCHKELAELYEDRLQTEGLTVSIEPAC
jgi:ATP-dependent Clp protease adaptor protein ClpS